MSTAFNTTLLSLGLKSADDYLREMAIQVGVNLGNKRLKWRTVRQHELGFDWQTEFLNFTGSMTAGELDNLLGHSAYAHIDPREVNKWFAKHPNIPIRFDEGPVDPALFYVGAYFGLNDLHWAGEADLEDRSNEWRPYTLNGKLAYRLGSRACGVKFYNIGQGALTPLVVIPTDNPRISIYAVKSWPAEEFALLKRIQNLRHLAVPRNELPTWGGLILPNVLVEKEIALGKDKIVGLNTTSYLGPQVRVFEAGMFLRLVLCPDGPLAEGAAKMGFAFESAMVYDEQRPNYLMDGDFCFGFVDSNVLSSPYVSAWVPVADFSSETINLEQFR